MTRQTAKFSMVVCAVQLASQADAFATLPQSNTASTSSLNLLPSQGNQLVAAYNAISVENTEAAPIKVDKDVSDASNKKNFLTRVFQLPSTKHTGLCVV